VKEFNLAEILDMTTPQLIERALAVEGKEFWLLAGLIAGRVEESDAELSAQLLGIGRVASWHENEEVARKVLRKLRDAVEKPS
jgi:hypothetical protein